MTLPAPATTSATLPAARPPLRVYLLSAALCLLTLLPVLGLQNRDSFPISTYPMFAARRGQPELHKLVAILPDGTSRSLPPEFVGSSEVLQAKVLVRRAVRAGPVALAALCARAAARTAQHENFQAALEIQIQQVRYDPVTYFESATPTTSQIVARCPVNSPATVTP